MSRGSKLQKQINQFGWLLEKGWSAKNLPKSIDQPVPFNLTKNGFTARTIKQAVAVEKGHSVQTDEERQASTEAAAVKRKAKAEYEASLPQYLLDAGWAKIEVKGTQKFYNHKGEFTHEGEWTEEIWKKDFDPPEDSKLPLVQRKTLKQAVKLQVKLDSQCT